MMAHRGRGDKRAGVKEVYRHIPIANVPTGTKRKIRIGYGGSPTAPSASSSAAARTGVQSTPANCRL